MQIIYRFILLLLMIFILLPGIFSDENQNEIIKIAITDFQQRGDATENEVEVLSEYIRSKIVETGVFEVIERSQLKNLISESAIQGTGLTSASNVDDIIKYGEINAVKMLLLGTVGRLYDQVIITVRLVNAETGGITFSNTLYSSKEDIYPNIKKLASEIADNGLLSITKVNMTDIENDIENKKFRKALQKIKRYMDSEENINRTSVLELKKEVEKSLAEQNFVESKKYLRKKYYREALDLINEAIILKGSEQYYQFRDKIMEDQEASSRKDAIRLERIKQQQEKDKLESEAGYLSFSELASLYYQNISASGFHLGVVTGVEISEKNVVSNLYEWWGGEFIYLGKLTGLNDFVDQIWYGGLLVNRKNEGGGYYSLGVQPWISPAFGFNLQIWNLLINMGLDLGGIVNLNNLVSGGVELGFSTGAMAMAEVKFLKSLGLYLTLKVDYEWILDPIFHSGLSARLSAGVTF